MLLRKLLDSMTYIPHNNSFLNAISCNESSPLLKELENDRPSSLSLENISVSPTAWSAEQVWRPICHSNWLVKKWLYVAFTYLHLACSSVNKVRSSELLLHSGKQKPTQVWEILEKHSHGHFEVCFMLWVNLHLLVHVRWTVSSLAWARCPQAQGDEGL